MSKLGKHKKSCKELRPAIKWLESLPEVLRVILGIHETARHSFSPGFIRYKLNTQGGIKLNGYSGNGVIDIFVKVAIENKEKLILKIKDRWPNE